MRDVRVCEVCGKAVTGTRRKYCSEACYRVKNVQKGGYRRESVDYDRIRQQEARHRLSQKKLSEINRLARETGMSYGQFVAKMNGHAL